MTKEMIGTLLRNVAKFGGGFVVAKGWADDATIEIIAGAIVAIFGAVWGILDARKAARGGAQ